MSEVLLRLKDVMAQTGLSRSSIYQQITNGSFPKPIKIGERAVAWLESQIQIWIKEKIDDAKSCSEDVNY